MIGHKDIEKSFKKLLKDNNLSHGYIFYGEPQVGKFLFAKYLANYIEKNDFALPEHVLSEALIIQPEKNPSSESGEKSVGIDAVRDLKNFLFQKPQNSKYRVAIINDAHLMTDQAQNAILKIAEEPPEHALLILVVSNPESLIRTVLSRFQKIYFGSLKTVEIENLLTEEHKIKPVKAKEIAAISFGRPGRAIDLVENERFMSIRSEAEDLLNKKKSHKDLVAELADILNRDKIEPFLGELIAELSRDVRKNYPALKAVMHRLGMIKEWNTNKRLQLEAALQSLKLGVGRE